MQQWPVISRSLDDLQRMSNPPSGQGVSEAVPWVFFDTETYVSGTTTNLRFFQTVKAQGLSNMPLAGQISAPEFFEPYFVGLDILSPPQANALTAWQDVWRVLFGTGAAGSGRPVATLTVSGKDYTPVPLSFLHGSGGPSGFGWSQAASAGTTSAEMANNSVPDGGFPMGGSPMIPPTVGFGWVVTWPAAVTLSADRSLSMYLAGTLHRRVL